MSINDHSGRTSSPAYPPSDDDRVRVITAKFDSRCRKCRAPLTLGSKIRWSKNGGAFCLDCNARRVVPVEINVSVDSAAVAAALAAGEQQIAASTEADTAEKRRRTVDGFEPAVQVETRGMEQVSVAPDESTIGIGVVVFSVRAPATGQDLTITRYPLVLDPGERHVVSVSDGRGDQVMADERESMLPTVSATARSLHFTEPTPFTLVELARRAAVGGWFPIPLEPEDEVPLDIRLYVDRDGNRWAVRISSDDHCRIVYCPPWGTP